MALGRGATLCAALVLAAACALALVADADARRLSSRSKISTAGLGPVKIGMTVRRAERRGRVDLVSMGPSLHGCRYVRPRNRRIRAMFMVVKRRIVRVDVRRRGIRTLSGFRVGSSERAVRKAFRGRLRVTPHEYREGGWYLEYVPRDRVERGRRVIFETNGRRVTYIRAGKLPQVRYIEGCA